MLSPADIILVLCDSFYNDLKPVHDLTLQAEQINTEIDILKSYLQDRRQQQQSVLCEDDERQTDKSRFVCKRATANHKQRISNVKFRI